MEVSNVEKKVNSIIQKVEEKKKDLLKREVIEKIENDYIYYDEETENIHFYNQVDNREDIVNLSEIYTINLRPRNEVVNETGLVKVDIRKNKYLNNSFKVLLLPFTTLYKYLFYTKNILFLIFPIVFFSVFLYKGLNTYRTISIIVFFILLVLKDGVSVPFIRDRRMIERKDILILKMSDKNLEKPNHYTEEEVNKMIEIYHFNENEGDKVDEIEDIYIFICEKMREKGYVR